MEQKNMTASSGSDKSANGKLGLLDEEIELLYEECYNRLQEAEHDLMDVAEERAEADFELVNRVFKAFHSVKGAGAFLVNSPLKNLSHSAENMLGEICDGETEMTPERAQILLSVIGCLKAMTADNQNPGAAEFDRESEEWIRILAMNSSRTAGSLHIGDEKSQAHAFSMLTPGAGSASTLRPRLKILLVEDDFTSRVILRGLLRAYGDCHIAVNGKEAVEAFRDACDSPEHYDLVCMDVRMPEMDGTEAVRQIRAIEEEKGVSSSSGAKIFMTTAIHDLKTVNASYWALCDAYLLKPVDGAQLQQHLLAFGLVHEALR
jgi:two-component system chemotaxis response regulator CheY